MIKAVIVEPQPRFRSFTPYWRNDLAIKEEFGTPIINNQLSFYEREKIKWIFFSYASFWADFREIVQFASLHPESQFGWIINEYNIELNSAIRKILKTMDKKLFRITNFVMKKKELGRDYLMTNLNTLILSDPELTIKEAISKKRYDLVYYGMYRKGREKYFKRYFDDRIIVSTSKKNVLLFKELIKEKRPRFITPLSWDVFSQLRRFRFSLYIEDEYTHSNYNYPANRFYEALMNRTILLFDENCQSTFLKAKYDIRGYVVKDRDSLWKKIAEIRRNLPLHLRRQALWIRRANDERERTIDDLRPYFDGKRA